MITTVEQLIRETAGLNTTSIEKVAFTKVDREEVKKISVGLIKISSLPYKEESYNSIQEIMKIAADSLNSLINDLTEKDEKLNHLTKVAEIRNIIDSMLDRKLIEKNEIQEKTAELIKKSDRELEIVKEAIALGSVTSKNIFFEIDKMASNSSSEKRGIFDGVIN